MTIVPRVFETDLDAANAVGKSAAKRTLERLGASKAKTGKFPVIYDRRVAASLVSTVASAINGAAVARGTSFLKDQLGKKIAADGLHFIDDPLRPRGMGSRPFDAEGCPVQTRKMVEDGVFKDGFLICHQPPNLAFQAWEMPNVRLAVRPAPEAVIFISKMALSTVMI
ncbi:MAG: hypothetical protein CM15mP46_3830 [Alphaproteobacteria bacterium]|nr:MAG: hypothetical protein CM15mP46_3830 [Alphaproteobacteria bacterium]